MNGVNLPLTRDQLNHVLAGNVLQVAVLETIEPDETEVPGETTLVFVRLKQS